MHFILPSGERSPYINASFIMSKFTSMKEKQAERALDVFDYLNRKYGSDLSQGMTVLMTLESVDKIRASFRENEFFASKMATSNSSYDSQSYTDSKYQSYIDWLERLLKVTFPQHFQCKVPSASILSEYFGELVTVDTSPVDTNDVEINFSRGSISSPDFKQQRKAYETISKKLSEIKINHYLVRDLFKPGAEFFPDRCAIPWFYVPELFKKLTELGYDVGEEKSKHTKSALSSFPSFSGGPETIPPPNPFTGFYNIRSSGSKPSLPLLSDLFSPIKEKKETSDESKAALRQKVINHFVQLGLSDCWKDKIEISGCFDFLGETLCFISPIVPFKEIKEFTLKLQKLGLKCNASQSLIEGCRNSLTIYMGLNELEKSLQNKVSENSVSQLSNSS